jgi:hypothetical protein
MGVWGKGTAFESPCPAQIAFPDCEMNINAEKYRFYAYSPLALCLRP